MKLVLLLSLLGITVVSGVFLEDGYGGGNGYRPRDSYESLDSSSSESSEGGRRRRTRRPRPRPQTPPCPSDWMTFDRPQGRWCVKVYTGNINWYDAQTQCQTLGATITGVQDDTERMALADEGRRLARAIGVDLASIWLGGTRKPECPRPGICRPEDTFQWVDGFTTGKAGFHWAYLEPDAYLDGTITQDTIHLLVFTNGNTHPTWPNSFHGDLDDQWFTELRGPSTRFYACGKKP